MVPSQLLVYKRTHLTKWLEPTEDYSALKIICIQTSNIQKTEHENFEILYSKHLKSGLSIAYILLYFFLYSFCCFCCFLYPSNPISPFLHPASNFSLCHHNFFLPTLFYRKGDPIFHLNSNKNLEVTVWSAVALLIGGTLCIFYFLSAKLLNRDWNWSNLSNLESIIGYHVGYS